MSAQHYRIGYHISVVLFAFLGLVAVAVIPICYAPFAFVDWFGPRVLQGDAGGLLGVLLADRAATAQACVALLAYATALFCFHRERQVRRTTVLREILSSLREARAYDGGRRADNLVQRLSSADPVRTFIEGLPARFDSDLKKVDPQASLELLERRLVRENNLHVWGKVMIVLGLLGMLLGLYIGFVLYAKPNQQVDLSALINQCIIVVAAASVSSVVGIGLGELVVAPLANRLDKHAQQIVDLAIALENALEMQATPASTATS